MAGIRGLAQVSEIALVSSTAKTVIQLIAPASQRVLIKRWGVYFDGIDPLGQPVEVVLQKQTTAGTMSALTPVKITPGSETLNTTATYNASGEPTYSDIRDMVEVHPQSGYEYLAPFGEEIILAGGERIGITCTAPAGVNVRAKIWFEE